LSSWDSWPRIAPGKWGFFARAFVAAVALGSLVSVAEAQQPGPSQLAGLSQLPDAPGRTTVEAVPAAMDPGSSTSLSQPLAKGSPNGGFGGQGAGHSRTASPFDKYILPGEHAPKLTVFDKTVLSLRHTTTPFAAGSWVVIAGYELATDGSPNYGQTFKGYMQRVGASAARGSSEEIFSDGVLASVLHEDPRYYKMGEGHSLFARLFYAGTRGLVTRTDGGRSTINFSSLGGNLAGAALTPVYYPPENRNFNQVMKTFGGSVGGTAFGDVVAEFLNDSFYRVVHLKHSSD
jgi:hypothetical protein